MLNQSLKTWTNYKNQFLPKFTYKLNFTIKKSCLTFRLEKANNLTARWEFLTLKNRNVASPRKWYVKNVILPRFVTHKRFLLDMKEKKNFWFDTSDLSTLVFLFLILPKPFTLTFTHLLDRRLKWLCAHLIHKVLQPKLREN